jgi:hypothetical protein
VALKEKCCGSGSGAFLTPGSQIPNPYFLEFSDEFLSELVQIFSLPVKKLNNFKFRDICDYKKKVGQQIFSPSSFVPVVGSGIQGSRSGKDKIQDPGSTSRISNTAE